MKVYQTHEIKNIALLGNDGAGKTTLTESLLYEAGIIKRRGRITQKNTVSSQQFLLSSLLCQLILGILLAMLVRLDVERPV